MVDFKIGSQPPSIASTNQTDALIETAEQRAR
jgi:hypothetical protein